VRAGGFLVLEPNFHLGRDKVRWERLLFFFALIAVPAILSSCGSSASTSTTTPTISISCVPSSVTVLGTSQCTATVTNLSSTLVNWTVGGTGTGSITSGGLYTAPATVPTNNVVTITATSQVQSTLTTTQNLTLVQPTAISAVACVDPNNNNQPSSLVSSGNTLSCTATASNGATVPVNWSITNKNNPKVTLNLGSISPQGVYTASLVPPPGQIVTITATSQALATQTMSVPVTVVFGDKVLSGPYVFSTTGRLPTHAFWARVGSFTAGGGSLLGIDEDTNQGGSPNIVKTQRPFSGSYSVGPDGRGTMQFCEDTSSSCPLGSSSATAYFRIVVISPQQAQIIEFSSPAASSATITGGGEMISQDPSVSGAGDGNLSGTYSFEFAGVSSSATEESAVGEFAANGFGTISAGSSVAPLAPGEMDINAGGPVTLATSIYSISSNGRGTVTLGGLTFSFYPVSASRAKFIEIDPVPPSTTVSSILVGDAFKQQTSSTCGWSLNALNGSTLFETSGQVTLGASSGFVIADVGSFTASNGAVSAASIDENNGGTVTSTVGTLTGNYTMDPCGRGTLSIGSHTYVFYIISASDAVLQETTIASGVIARGFLVPSQGGPFVDSTLTGSYAFRLAGTDAAGTAGHREDFLGQFTSNGSGTGLAGTLDFNDFGATQAGVAIANGTYLPVPAGSLRATMAFPLTTTPSTTRNFVLYMVSPTLFYALDTDPAPSGTAIGVIDNQF
jgi:hypothetical protein